MMPDWLSTDMLLALAAASVICFIGTLIIFPILLIRLPTDYFSQAHPRAWLRNHHPVIRVTAYVIKNAVGVVFLFAGIAMLLLPGQGLLTMLIGISLIDFPGKRKLERRLLGTPALFKTINKVREKFGRPPLIEHDRSVD